VLHLRWHYQVFILSGGFLLGGLLSTNLDLQSFLTQFCNVHLLLFGGATAYNSFWDKDTGPIGGLKNPPPMAGWMWYAALILQAAGLVLAILAGILYVSIYAVSLFFFWIYSTPLARWKSHPLKSLIAIGLSTGFNSVLLGYLAAGNSTVPVFVLVAAFGVMFVLLSLYPLSQIYQLEEDRRRGDQTFAVQFGAKGVKRFFAVAFSGGLLLITIAVLDLHPHFALLFGGLGFMVGLLVQSILQKIEPKPKDYATVMKIKYGTSLAFVAFLVFALVLKHAPIRGIAPLVELLLK
jgi:4-hydroxybenzoate polyprenyltransferase